MIIIQKGKWMKGIVGFFLMISALAFIVIINVKNDGVFSFADRKLPIYCVDTKEKKIALTFDASWKEDNTDEIIKILDKYNVKATFFLVGSWIDANPDKLKILYDKGHEIGNHSNTHPDMNSISREALIKEINAVDEKIKKITGSGTTLFRCPSGDYNDSVISTVESTGKYCIQWDVDSIDWRNEGANLELDRVIKKTSPGSIILFHNDARFTPRNLPIIIEYFKKRGFSLVTVSELIYKKNYIIDYSGKQIYNK
ncbi:MAG: polysaccharide deacetylase family sporulation protein PdaB [Bacillota bacterium]|nr:polysaccharide deacetylase family sporulation protein PdaB [Bacillota bacterium]